MRAEIESEFYAGDDPFLKALEELVETHEPPNHLSEDDNDFINGVKALIKQHGVVLELRTEQRISVGSRTDNLIFTIIDERRASK